MGQAGVKEAADGSEQDKGVGRFGPKPKTIVLRANLGHYLSLETYCTYVDVPIRGRRYIHTARGIVPLAHNITNGRTRSCSPPSSRASPPAAYIWLLNETRRKRAAVFPLSHDALRSYLLSTHADVLRYRELCITSQTTHIIIPSCSPPSSHTSPPASFGY